MKLYLTFSFFFTILTFNAQVGIGTTTPDDGSALEIQSTTGALIPPRVTTTQMNNIPTPLDGAIVYNSTINSLFIRSNGAWSTLTNSSKGSLIVNKNYPTNNSAIIGTDNTYYEFPIGTSEVIANDTSLYSVIGNGTVRIKEAGNYFFSGSFSTYNAPSGNKKYIIAVTVDNTLVGYLSRGFTSLPSSDYWGTSGNLMYPIAANQVVKFRYVFNNNNNSIHAVFFNFGINKLN
ncbi:hypothetical protein ULMS_26540 [Patiriisocius marinistellae]|uniref:Uncharacterized protein n=1 Tax=Patiriisocius marinistellae TaxID=2494560 RepID=A0A5J4G2Y3_9FLAO|nr:hypothetical protein [Patiriisocius marinistellae]GEQ87146.1 hypothetical protein ULMS_26540 [Patiriisocius marinistellae]